MEDMNEMLEQEEMNLDVHKGSVVEGKVVDLTDDKSLDLFRIQDRSRTSAS